jgi:hypothetical protein
MPGLVVQARGSDKEIAASVARSRSSSDELARPPIRSRQLSIAIRPGRLLLTNTTTDSVRIELRSGENCQWRSEIVRR